MIAVKYLESNTHTSWFVYYALDIWIGQVTQKLLQKKMLE